MNPFPLPSGITVPSGLLTTLSGLLNGKNFRKFAPRRLTAKQRLALRQFGVGNEVAFAVRPDLIPKMIMDNKCDLCFQELPPGTVQCFRCGNCVFCGAYNNDHYANTCLTCGNDAPGRTDDTDIMVHTNTIRP